MSKLSKQPKCFTKADAAETCRKRLWLGTFWALESMQIDACASNIPNLLSYMAYSGSRYLFGGSGLFVLLPLHAIKRGLDRGALQSVAMYDQFA